ncbi:Mu transposase C-terminal domain-containing protein, partial [Enterocloster sp. 210928-DFI.2.20]
IRKFGQVYNHPELIYYMDKPVDIKYDPEDVTRLLVFDAQDGHMICEAESQELLKIAHKVPQEALERHIRLQKQQMKDVREKLKEMR